MPIDLLSDDVQPKDLLADEDKQPSASDNTVLGKLGLGQNPYAQVAAGMTEMSPIGMAAGGYNLLRAAPQHPLMMAALNATPGTQPLANIATLLSKGPEIPAFGQGGAYTAGEATNVLGGLGYGAYKLGTKGISSLISKLKTQPVADSIYNLAEDASKFAENKTSSLTDDIKNSLMQGKTRLENAKSFSQEIQDSYNNVKSQGKKMYENAMGDYANKKMYAPRFVPTEIKKMDVPDSINDSFNNFLNEPTFNNAHKLQSDLGYEIRDLQSTKLLTRQDKSELSKLISYRDIVQNAFKDRLDTIDPTGNLHLKFKDSSTFWANNVAPYERGNILRQIIRNKDINPRKIMKGMEDILSTNDVDTIESHLGNNFNRYVLANEIGKISNLTANKLSNSLNNLPAKGLEIYKPPGLDDQLRNLDTAISNRDLIKNLSYKISHAEKPSDILDVTKGENINLIPGLKENLIALQKKVAYKKLAKTGAITGGIYGGLSLGKGILENIRNTLAGGQ